VKSRARGIRESQLVFSRLKPAAGDGRLPSAGAGHCATKGTACPDTSPSKLLKHQLEESLLIITKAEKHSSSRFLMPRNSVKAAKVRKDKSKAKVIEWQAQVHSRGVRDVPVEVTAAGSQPKQREKAGKRPRAEKNDTLPSETALQPMDVDETFWVEEPVMPTAEKRVRQPPCPSSMSLTFLSPSTLILRNLSPRSALTYPASLILRAFQRRLHARAATLLRSSGGALTVFLHVCSARSVAESRTSCFLFTEFKNGWENTSCHRGCGRLGCAYNLGTLGMHALIKLCAVKLFML